MTASGNTGDTTGTLPNGDERKRPCPDDTPGDVIEAVYAMGFSPDCTAVLDCRPPYVLLLTPARRVDPFSIVSLETRRTVERFDRPEHASRRLGELAGEP